MSGDIEKLNEKIHMEKRYSEKKSTYDLFINGLDKINDISELEDEQIIKLREKLKEIDVKLKEKTKPKTITISGEAHNMIKNHCSLIKENVGEWSEKILVDKIKDNLIKFLSIIENNLTINGIFPKVLPIEYVSRYVETQALPYFKINYNIDEIFNPFFIKYVSGWAKTQQGNILGRYDFSLPGGIKINHYDLISEGKNEMNEVIDDLKDIHKIILIDSIRTIVNNKSYECGVMECNSIEEFLEKIKGKTTYLYSISHREEGINMCSADLYGTNLRIRYFTI